MDIEYELRGVRFRWNQAKAKLNAEKPAVSFEQAAQVLFDPFVRYVDASRGGEQRDGAVGCDFEFRILVGRSPPGRGRIHSNHFGSTGRAKREEEL